MFENLIKITRDRGVRRKNDDNEIKFPAFSGNFINVKDVKMSDLNEFLEALKSFNEKLDVLIVELYKSDKNKILHDEYDNIVSELNKKESQIKYLQSYFEMIQLKIEAFQKHLHKKEAALKKMEDKKNAIQSKLINLKKNMRKNQSKQIVKFVLSSTTGINSPTISRSQSDGDITLNLSTIGNASSDNEYTSNMSDCSDLN